ncbi:MAG TPA: ribokinase [Terriglobia bacterium]|nr:ribokinase [Terriglobia bacterium]
MHKPIVVVGSINLDLVARVERIPALGETLTGNSFETFFGGKGANQAVGVARLGHSVVMIGRVGGDEFGDRLRQGLSDAGVATKAVKRTPGVSSGVALISVASQGRNTIIVIPGANGRLTPADLENELPKLSSAGMILTQLEVPLNVVAFLADFAWARRIPLILDPSPARKLPVSLLRKVAWLTPNETETCTLCGIKPGKLNPQNVARYAKSLLEKGPGNVVIKLGTHGAFWGSAEGPSAFVPAFRVRAVDSTAAGDAFNAGLAVALMKMNGQPAPSAVRYASAVAALSATRDGAQPSMPTATQVAKFLNGAK